MKVSMAEVNKKANLIINRVAESGQPCSFETHFEPLERHFQIAAVPFMRPKTWLAEVAGSGRRSSHNSSSSSLINLEVH